MAWSFAFWSLGEIARKKTRDIYIGNYRLPIMYFLSGNSVLWPTSRMYCVILCWRVSLLPGEGMVMTAEGGLAGWAERSALRRAGGLIAGGVVPGRLRFVFYGRVSTEDWQDPVTSRARQREQAEALVRDHGVIMAPLFDVGESRAVAWARRPQAAALVAQLADPDRGWDAIVIGEYERAFYGSQYAAMAPLFEHYGSSCGCPRLAAGSTTSPSMTRRR
jgi:hypothetical protein